MISHLVPAFVDLAFLLLFWLPGVLAAWLVGARTVSHALPLGFVFSATLLTLWYSMLSFAGWQEFFWLSSKVIFVLALAPLLFLAARAKASPTITAWIPLIIASVTVAGRNVFLLDTRPGFSDQFLVGYIGWLMQSGTDPSVFGSVEYLKRSFAAPLLLASGREGFLLISMIPLMAIVLILATYHLLTVTSRRFSPKLRAVTFAAVMSLWATTSFFWGMFGYQNSHVLVALTVTVLASTVLSFSQSTPPPALLTSVAIFSSSFVLAQARIEAAALALLIALPLLNALPGMPIRHARMTIVALTGAPIGFMLWLMTTRATLLEPLPPVALVVLLIPFIALAAVKRVPLFLGQLLLPAAFGILAGLSVWYLFIFGDRALRWEFTASTFLGEGQWGYIAIAFVVILALTIFHRRTQPENWIIWMTLIALMFTLDTKIIDGLFVIGEVGGYGRGWTASVNRGFFHSFGLLTVMTASGMLALTTPLSTAPDAANKSRRRFLPIRRT